MKIKQLVIRTTLAFFFMHHSHFAMEGERGEYFGKRSAAVFEQPAAKRSKTEDVVSLRQKFWNLVDHEDKRGIDNLINEYPSFIDDCFVSQLILPFAQASGYNDLSQLTAFTKMRLLGGCLENLKICRIDRLDSDALNVVLSYAKQHDWKSLILVCRDWQRRVDASLQSLIFENSKKINVLRSYPMDFTRFPGIKSLKLYESVDNLEGLTNLSSLEFYGSVKVCKELTAFENLTKLRLSGNNMEPDCIKKITSSPVLKILHLDGFSLDVFYFGQGSADLSHLTNIQHLDLGASKYKIENRHVQSLTNLKRLDCNFNGMTDEGISGLTNLVFLNLSNNYENTITDVGISNLTNLKILDCSKNITDIGISNLTKLQSLKCSENITDNGISNLTNLKSLDCNKKISDNGIMNLTNLTSLACNENITDVGINSLTDLRYIHLRGNRKISRPCLLRLTKLQRVVTASQTLTIRDGHFYHNQREKTPSFM